ncbi:MAG: response regulator transcription factor [Chitinophagaceae bacterium]|jgi:DNA-binding NarL/FixJ family response regulator|nr:response regulator transcription factor [Chitinophagaceae bacterium]HAK10975.1 DNA-binding response regulator [Chitinophagaceae bacterium]
MPLSSKRIFVALADDHTLFRKALAGLVASFDRYSVLFDVENGLQLKEQLENHKIPDVVLLDVNMPGMNGYESCKWIVKNFPQVKVLGLSMNSDENSIIKMIKSGAKGYLLKNVEPDELLKALDSVMNQNFYLSADISAKVISGLNREADLPVEAASLSEKEREFIHWVCTELSYKDIADKMYISPRTVEDYRNSLFEKFGVHTRMGLVIYAIKNKLVTLEESQ